MSPVTAAARSVEAIAPPVPSHAQPGDAYTARHLSVLEGLEAVRKRPGMYIGSTDGRGLLHCLWEIIDNAVDEALGGHCTRIEVILHEDHSAEVRDNGRGIPVDAEPKTGLNGVELVMTRLHAGGKFGGGSYTASGRSSTTRIVSPGTRYAVWRARWASASKRHSAPRTNTCWSGQNLILVPVSVLATRRILRSPVAGRNGASGPGPLNSPGTPRRKLAAHSAPPRPTSTSSRPARALTTDAPTPCRPPDAV